MILITFAFALGSLGAAQSAGVGTAMTRFEIPRDAIYKTITEFLQQNHRQENVSLSPADLQLPQGFTSAKQYPELEVAGIMRNVFAHEWQISMRCRERSSCGSFLVLLNDGASFLSIPLFRHISHMDKTQTDVRPVLVQSGKPAVLVMQSSATRITLPVVCLQRGVLDQVIDARDPETKKVLRAKVIGRGLLLASF